MPIPQQTYSLAYESICSCRGVKDFQKHGAGILRLPLISC